MEAKIDSGKLTLNLWDLFAALGEEDRRKVAAVLAMEDAITDAVVNQIVEGYTSDGSWTTAEHLEQMRVKVLEAAPGILAAVAREVIVERERLEAVIVKVNDYVSELELFLIQTRGMSQEWSIARDAVLRRRPGFTFAPRAGFKIGEEEVDAEISRVRTAILARSATRQIDIEERPEEGGEKP